MKTYPDPYDKPEMVIALQDFGGFAGFQNWEDIKEVFGRYQTLHECFLEKIGQIESKDLDSQPEIPVEKEISDTGKRIINGFEIEGLEEEEEEMKDFEKHFLGNDNDLGNYWEEKEEDSGKESDNEKLSMRSEMSIDKPIDEDFAKAKEMTVTENLSHLKLEDVMKLETMRGLNLPKDDLFGLQFEESGEENQAAQFLKEQGFKKN